jgi:hypothetical protein
MNQKLARTASIDPVTIKRVFSALQCLREEIRLGPKEALSGFIAELGTSSRKDVVILKMGVAMDEGVDLKPALPDLNRCLRDSGNDVRSSASGLLARYYLKHGDTAKINGLLSRREFYITHPVLIAIHNSATDRGDPSPYVSKIISLISDGTTNADVGLSLLAMAAEKGSKEAWAYFSDKFRKISRA